MCLFWSRRAKWQHGIICSRQCVFFGILAQIARFTWRTGVHEPRYQGAYGPLTRYVKLQVAHAPRMPETFSPPSWVIDPDMHHGTCVTHVPWCIPESLTSGFLWSRWQGKRSQHSRRMLNPQFFAYLVRSPCDMYLTFYVQNYFEKPWWRHQMEMFSALLAVCAGNSPLTCEFPTQGPVTWSFDIFFGLRLNKRFSKQWWGWWFETPSLLLWRHCNDIKTHPFQAIFPNVSCRLYSNMFYFYFL